MLIINGQQDKQQRRKMSRHLFEINLCHVKITYVHQKIKIKNISHS